MRFVRMNQMGDRFDLHPGNWVRFHDEIGHNNIFYVISRKEKKRGVCSCHLVDIDGGLHKYSAFFKKLYPRAPGTKPVNTFYKTKVTLMAEEEIASLEKEIFDRVMKAAKEHLERIAYL